MSPLARKILSELQASPRQFSEIADVHRDVTWREFLRAWGELRQAEILRRDDDGRYLIASDAAQER